MSRLQQLEAALFNAHKAGDTAAAQHLAAAIREERSAKQSPDNSAMRGFALGALKPLDNLTRAAMQSPLGRFVSDAGVLAAFPGATEAVASNDAARKNNTRTGWQVAGNIAGTLPTAFLPGGALMQGAAGGALLSEAKTAGGLLEDTLFGAATSKVAQLGLDRLGRAIAPKVSENVRKLADAGIPMTPGQAFGGIARGLENRAAGFGMVGAPIRVAQERGTMALNRKIINDALEDVGAKLPDDMALGRDAVAYAADTVSDAYNKLLPTLTVNADNPFQASLAGIRARAKNLPAGEGRNFEAAIGKDVLDALQKGGTLTGEGLKTLESKLSGFTSSLRKSPDAYQKMTGELTGELLDELRGAVVRSNPTKAAELQAINKAFAKMVRVERAAGAAGNASGVFTPKQYSGAVRSADQSSRKSAVARGRALGQELADAASDVLPSNVGDSGTAGRVAVAGGAGLLASGGATALGLANPYMVGAGLVGALPYTNMGQRALAGLISQPGPVRQGARKAFQFAGRSVPVAVPGLLAYQP